MMNCKISFGALTMLIVHVKYCYSGNCITNGGPSPYVPCIFPFTFDGITYNQCALDTDGYWCSTKVDSSGEHIEGHWGSCDENCPKIGTGG